MGEGRTSYCLWGWSRLGTHGATSHRQPLGKSFAEGCLWAASCPKRAYCVTLVPDRTRKRKESQDGLGHEAHPHTVYSVCTVRHVLWLSLFTSRVFVPTTTAAYTQQAYTNSGQPGRHPRCGSLSIRDSSRSSSCLAAPALPPACRPQLQQTTTTYLPALLPTRDQTLSVLTGQDPARVNVSLPTSHWTQPIPSGPEKTRRPLFYWLRAQARNRHARDTTTTSTAVLHDRPARSSLVRRVKARTALPSYQLEIAPVSGAYRHQTVLVFYRRLGCKETDCNIHHPGILR